MDAGSPDAGIVDAGAPVDAGSVQDAGVVVVDAGVLQDSGSVDPGATAPDASAPSGDAGWKPLPTNEEHFGPTAPAAAGCSCRTTGDVGNGDATAGVFTLVSILALLGMRRRAR